MRVLVTSVVFALLASGCIGAESTKPPIGGIRNMHNQPRYDTQERKPFFADQRSMRPEVEGTVSREMEKGYNAATGVGANSGTYVLYSLPTVMRWGSIKRDLNNKVNREKQTAALTCFILYQL